MAGLVLEEGGLASGLLVGAQGNTGNRDGVLLRHGGTVMKSTIKVPNGTAVYGFNTIGVADSLLEGSVGVNVHSAAGATVARCRVLVEERGPRSTGVITYTSKATVEDTLIDIGGLQGFGVYAAGGYFGPDETVLRNTTIVGTAGSSTWGVEAYAEHHQSASVRLDDSIIDGVQHTFRQSAYEAGSTTSVTSHYSSYDTAGDEQDSEMGAAEPSPPTDLNPVSTEPDFLHPVEGTEGFEEANWRLAPGSPLIDAGAPGSLGGEESTTDLAGNPRLVHGRRDVGAYEYQWTAPTVHASASATSAASGQAVQFSGSAQTSEPGDSVVSYQWTFDDGAVVPAGSSATHAFTTPGTHTATLTATDLAGAKGVATVKVTVPPPLSLVAVHPGTVSPKLSGVSETAKSWREGKALPLGVTKLPKAGKPGSGSGHPPVGTTFSFSLSEAATVTLTFTKPVSGRKVAGRCVAPTAANKKDRPCTRQVLAGAFTVSGKAGGNHLLFDGPISKHTKLAPGSYTVTITASTGGGRSAPATLHFTIAKG
jgi:PKD repeat protein